MPTAFGLVALSAQASWHEERFAELYLPQDERRHRDISVLSADLQGSTSSPKAMSLKQVTRMLNEYFEPAVPAVKSPHGGEIDRIIGDALMVTFNNVAINLIMLRARPRRTRPAESPSSSGRKPILWPRFRVGINSGPVSVSVLGTGGGRTHTIVGDTVNIASRIEGQAPAGGMAIGRIPRRCCRTQYNSAGRHCNSKESRHPLQVHVLDLATEVTRKV